MSCPNETLHAPGVAAVGPASGARLRVDLDALGNNYRALAGCTAAHVGAVIKANAYGSGVEAASRRLAAEGCTTFFVADAREGETVRRLCPDATVFVLTPVMPVDAPTLIGHDLLPCLNTLEDLDVWARACRSAGQRAAAAIHVETGINRAAMAAEDAIALAADHSRRQACEIRLLMGHLASADAGPEDRTGTGEAGRDANARQLAAFERVRVHFPGVPASFSNSATLALGRAYHFDLVRAGISLFGHDPHYRFQRPVCAPVMTLEASVAQVRRVPAGETIGYGGTFVCQRDTRIAVVMAGYADGIPWRLNDPATPVYHGGFGEHRAPLVGRVSMDLMTFDITELPPDAVSPGDWAELYGTRVPIEHMAECAGTMPYEILTQTGSRPARLYSDETTT